MTRRFLFFLASTAILVPAVLLLDRPGLASQLFLGLATATFLIGFARTSTIPMHQIGWAVVIATTGEAILSVGWGLYSYQHALLPLYVPAGHGVFYLLAAESAQQDLVRRHARAFLHAVLVAGSAVAATTLFASGDVWGLLWWIAAAALLLRSRTGALLPACFVFTLLLEWLGTALGNWTWAAQVPGLGLRSANPPSGVGLLYILLDLITVSIVVALQRVRVSPFSAPASATGARS